MKIVFDTNFLIGLVRFKTDLGILDELIDEKYHLATLSSVVKELERVSRRKTLSSFHAKAAIKMIKECKIQVIESRIHTDKALANLAKEGCLVATNDGSLRKELKALGRKTIYLKSKKHLAIG